MRRRRSSKGQGRAPPRRRDGKRLDPGVEEEIPAARRRARGSGARDVRAGAGDAAPADPPRGEPAVPTPDPNPKCEPEPIGEPQRQAPPVPRFPIVGIGASAGGLEALELFLRNVPKGSGMAFVVIQHLDPADRGAFVDLLRRDTPMPVEQAREGIEVLPDHVYVIPPARDLSVLNGRLRILPQTSPRGLNLPIDFFFRSLAEECLDRAIAVVLSGMGTDGTLGLRAVKEKGGATFVQALTSAKFDGMPRSALDAGLADVVADASELPGRIVAYHRHAAYIARMELPREGDRQASGLSKVFVLLRADTGNDFSLYKRSTVVRRIERRMGLHQIDKLPSYIRFLRENPGEVELLFKELLIGVTSFFRDPPAWDHLQKSVLPDVLAAHPQGGAIRAWVPGCSTGEEAYSLAMVLQEAIDERKIPELSVQVFATDLDREAIDRARNGVYPANIAADVSPERLRRFFVRDERGYRVSKDVRESVVFAPQNVIMDPPFTKLDLLSCRNLLIYLSPEVQKRLIPLFHYALNPGGILFLGSAETIGGFGALFAPLDGKSRLYRRLEEVAGEATLQLFSGYRNALPAHASAHGKEASPAEPDPPAPAGTRTNLQTLADRVIVQRFAPTAVLVNDRGDILYTSGRTGKYLEPAVGRATMNVFAMAREGLRYDLSSAFATAQMEDHPVTVRGVRVGTNGGTQAVDLTVQKLLQPLELRGTVMIVIADVTTLPPSHEKGSPRRAAKNARVRALEAEVQHAHEELQSTREEMQTSQEELKSMNEELQSTNEELQSTNEELTTSKEEMQSMNEELQTVNHELQAKIDELSRSNNDMKNLLNSTEIATLFLDGELLVRRFTAPTSRIIKLIPADAGRPITDIASELDYGDLAEDAREVLRTLVFKERLVSTRDRRWFNVRILPYRTLHNVIDGVVITFADVTATKATEEDLRTRADELRLLADCVPTLVWCCRPDGACDFVTLRWTEYTGVPQADHLGYGWLELVHPEDRDRVREGWSAAVRTGAPFDTSLRLRDREGSFRWFKSRSIPIQNDRGTIVRWYGTHTDVDDLRLPGPSGGEGNG